MFIYIYIHVLYQQTPLSGLSVASVDSTERRMDLLGANLNCTTEHVSKFLVDFS